MLDARGRRYGGTSRHPSGCTAVASCATGATGDRYSGRRQGPRSPCDRRAADGLGAILTGRRTFDKAHGWDGNHAWGPAFVLTHQIPDGWPRPNSTVHFVTDGIESAVRQAKAAVGGKNVGVHGADTIQQLLNVGLLDELHIDIAALLLGSGVRLFDRLAGTPVVLGNPTVIPGVGVKHLRYPARKI